MTLVAATLTENLPSLIGDILITITNPDEDDEQTEIPTFLDELDNIHPGTGVFTFELRQKIYVINDNLCVALAGRVLSMTHFLEDIKTEFNYRDANIQNLQKFCNEYDADVLSKIEYFVLLKNSDNSFFRKKSDGWKFTVNQYIKGCFSAGTGDDDFILEVDKLGRSLGYGFGNNDAISMAMLVGILARLMGFERNSIQRMKNLWGAGFELILFKEGRFQKVQSSTYIIKTISLVDLHYYKTTNEIVFNYKYQDDLLIITATDFIRTKFYNVLPLDKKLNDYNNIEVLHSANFDLKVYSICYLLHGSAGNFEIVKTISFSKYNDEIRYVTFHADVNNNVQLNIDSNFEKDILSNVIELKHYTYR